MTTTPDIADLRQLLVAATPAGKWSLKIERDNDDNFVIGVPTGPRDRRWMSYYQLCEGNGDEKGRKEAAKLIVELRNHAAALLDAYEDLQRLRGASGSCAQCEALTRERDEARRVLEVRTTQVKELQDIIRNDTTPAGREVAAWRSERDALRAKLGALVAFVEKVRANGLLESECDIALIAARIGP